MKLQDQVCSLEQAKRFKELGITQIDSYFSWLGDVDYETGLKSDDGKNYAAFTVAELGVMLPSETYTQRTGSDNSEYANWEWIDEGNQIGAGMFPTEAKAKADHLIYLLENKLTTPEEVNQRLTA